MDEGSENVPAADDRVPMPAGVDVRRPGLVVSVRRDGGSAVVVVAGELDLASVDGFTSTVDRLLVEPPDAIVLDWSDLTFIDSSGVGAYVQVYRRARAAGVALSLGSRSQVVDRVLQLSGVEDALSNE